MNKVVPSNAVLVPPQAERKFRGIIYDVYQWQQELFDGKQTTFKCSDDLTLRCVSVSWMTRL